MASEPTHVITDNPHVVQTGRDLALEAAATLAALLDVRKERTLANQQFTVRRKKLEKRAEELIDEIRNGPNNQLKLHFGSAVALANSAPEEEEQIEPTDDVLEEEVPVGDNFDEQVDENEALH